MQIDLLKSPSTDYGRRSYLLLDIWRIPLCFLLIIYDFLVYVINTSGIVELSAFSAA